MAQYKKVRLFPCVQNYRKTEHAPICFLTASRIRRSISCLVGIYILGKPNASSSLSSVSSKTWTASLAECSANRIHRYLGRTANLLPGVFWSKWGCRHPAKGSYRWLDQHITTNKTAICWVCTANIPPTAPPSVSTLCWARHLIFSMEANECKKVYQPVEL